jgi:hypothetical protein
VQLGRWLSFQYGQLATQGAPEPKYFPHHFLQTWKVISQRVKQAGVVSEFALLKLAKVTPAARNTVEFAEALKNLMRRGDLLVFFDPVTVGLWLPGTSSNYTQAVLHRLMKSFPLDVIGIESKSEPQFFELLFSVQKNASQNCEPVELTQECLNRWGLGEMASRIWVPSMKAGWTNLCEQKADFARESLLDRIQIRARGSLLVRRHVTLEDRFAEVKLMAFRPTGTLDFAYEALPRAEMHERWERFLNACRASALQKFIIGKPTNSVEPIPFFIVKALLLALSRQHKLSCLEVSLSRDEVLSSRIRSLQLIASTEDGDRRGLAVAAKEAA